jgi:ribonuclease VapC
VNVFDASALLAFLRGEEGSALVEDGLRVGGVCGTANWSEVAQAVRAYGRDWELARALLSS